MRTFGLICCLLCGAGSVLAADPAVYRDDFSTLAVGPADTNNSGTRDLGDAGAKTNGWQGRQLQAYLLATEAGERGQVLQLVADGSPAPAHVLGKAHALPLGHATVIELTAQVALRDYYSSALLWLSDDKQNGYGLLTTRGNYNTASIIKLRGNTVGFQDNAPATWSVATGEHSGAREMLPIGLQVDGYLTLHLRLEQAAPKQPVTLTFWYTGSSAQYPDTSYDKPAQRLVDAGDGKVFNAGAPDKFGPPLNLATLTHLALTASARKDPKAYVKFDEVRVAVQ